MNLVAFLARSGLATTGLPAKRVLPSTGLIHRGNAGVAARLRRATGPNAVTLFCRLPDPFPDARPADPARPRPALN